jgi:hypothetical protein
MTQVFIIQNHDQTYLNKQGDWVDGSDASQLFRSLHKDEAINVKVEQSVRNPHLRLSILACELDAKEHLRLGQTILSPSVDSTTELMFNDEPARTENSELSLNNSEGTN